MQRLKVSSKMRDSLDRGADVTVRVVFYMIALTVGLHYITQKDLVLEPGSTFQGWSILVVVLVMVGYKGISWLRRV